MLALRGSSLGGNQVVDAGGQVAQHEILLGRGLALVDLLSPALQGQFDRERLVDGEGDIEEIQAVDAEVVDGVTFRLDVLTRNIANLGDDIGHGVEGRGHRQVSVYYRL